MDRYCTQSSTHQIIELDGWLDNITGPDWEKQFEEYLREPPKYLFIDCARLDYVSSAGFRLLLEASGQISENQGKLVFFSMKDYIHEVIEISGLESLFPIEEPNQATLLMS